MKFISINNKIVFHKGEKLKNKISNHDHLAYVDFIYGICEQIIYGICEQIYTLYMVFVNRYILLLVRMFPETFKHRF